MKINSANKTLSTKYYLFKKSPYRLFTECGVHSDQDGLYPQNIQFRMTFFDKQNVFNNILVQRSSFAIIDLRCTRNKF